MALIAPKTESKRELVPQGTHIARVYQLVEIGTIQTNMVDNDGNKKIAHQIRIGFELPGEMREFNGEQKPMVISKDYTLSMHEKSSLRNLINALVGNGGLTDAEAANFDVHEIIGMTCMVNVIHSESGYANIQGHVPMPKGMQAPASFNPPMVLTYEKWNPEIFEKLPTFITDKMKTSKEYRNKFVAGAGTDEELDTNDGITF